MIKNVCCFFGGFFGSSSLLWSFINIEVSAMFGIAAAITILALVLQKRAHDMA